MLTAWAAGKFDAERIAKAVKATGVPDKISHRKIIIPGVRGQHLRRAGGGAARLGGAGGPARGHRYPVLPETFGEQLIVARERDARGRGRWRLCPSSAWSQPDRTVQCSRRHAPGRGHLPGRTARASALRRAGDDAAAASVEVREGSVRRRSTLRLSEEEIRRGYALACQTLVDRRRHRLGASSRRATRALGGRRPGGKSRARGSPLPAPRVAPGCRAII